MRFFRFSPIKNESKLLEAIKHTHFACFKLCKKAFGKYISVAGNMGIFCHYNDEYKFLTELRKELTEESDNLNQKYFRLHNPVIIPVHEDVPETTYTYLSADQTNIEHKLEMLILLLMTKNTLN